MSSFKHSMVLFTDETGHPLKFYMRPCAEKQRLHPLIEHGGGILSSKWTDGMYRLIEPGCRVLNKSGICLSSQFIWDCVANNCLLDIKKYRITVETAEISDISEDEASRYTIQTTRKSLRARHEYTDEDDYTILNYIIKSQRYNEAKGRRIWVNLQDRKALRNRTWQSLRERYIKKIVPNIHKYDIDEKHRKLILNPFNQVQNDDESNISEESDTYTLSDDLLILNILFQNGRLQRVNEDDVWKEVEDTKETDHSWKSLKNRFFEKIIPSLNTYNLSLQQIDELSNAVQIPSVVLTFARNAARKLAVNAASDKSHSSSASENESDVQKYSKRRKNYNSATKRLFSLDKAEISKNGTDECISTMSKELPEPKTKKAKKAPQVETSCHSLHKKCTDNALSANSPSSSGDSSVITNFEDKCLLHYRFQQTMPKYPIKKLSMRAIQQHVAEIKESPQRNSSKTFKGEHQGCKLKSVEKEHQQTAGLNIELPVDELLDSQASVSVQNIVDALDGDWPDETIVKFSEEESNDDNSTIIASINTVKRAKDTIETCKTEKSPLHKNIKSSTQSSAGMKNSSTSSLEINSGITKDPSEECQTPSENKQISTNQPLKHRLRKGKKLVKKRTEPCHTETTNNDHCNRLSNRKGSTDNLENTNSETITTQDLTSVSSLNTALNYVKNIKKMCNNWCSSSDRSDISIPVNSMNCIQKKLDELHALLYKTHLMFLSNEVMKKSQRDIGEDDILVLLKFLIVYGNYNFEDISNIFSNNTSH